MALRYLDQDCLHPYLLSLLGPSLAAARTAPSLVIAPFLVMLDMVSSTEGLEVPHVVCPAFRPCTLVMKIHVPACIGIFGPVLIIVHFPLPTKRPGTCLEPAWQLVNCR